jgi:hypothetical protein
MLRKEFFCSHSHLKSLSANAFPHFLWGYFLKNYFIHLKLKEEIKRKVEKDFIFLQKVL